MPIPFDRFRLLNEPTKRLRNESRYMGHVKVDEEDPGIELAPGQEVELPPSPEVILDIEIPEK